MNSLEPLKSGIAFASAFITDIGLDNAVVKITAITAPLTAATHVIELSPLTGDITIREI